MATNTVSNTIQIKKRGCGWPIAGGSYIYVSEKEFNENTPLGNHVIDPTVPIEDPQGYGVSSIGMSLKSRRLDNGTIVQDLFDWIGEGEYPNPLDWLLEVNQIGFHQKINPVLLKHLSPESFYFAIHARAGIYWEDLESVYAYRENFTHPSQPKCFGNHDAHIKLPADQATWSALGTCAGLFFNDITRGKVTKDSVVIREMPSFSYDAFEAIPGIKHEAAIFFRLPIGRMAQFLVYKDNETNTHEAALKELEKIDERIKRIRTVQL